MDDRINRPLLFCYYKKMTDTKTVVTEASTVAAVGLAAPAVGVGILNAVGFTAGGVAAGTAAAAAQAGIGNVVAGSAFAAAQSVAAMGVGSAIVSVGVPLAAVGLLGYGIYKIFSCRSAET